MAEMSDARLSQGKIPAQGNDFRIAEQNLRNNPFNYRTPKLEWYEWVKIVLVTCTGIPLIRILLTIIINLILLLYYLTLTCCLLIEEKPRGTLRFFTTWPGYIGCRAILFVWGFYYIPRKFPKCGGSVCGAGCCMSDLTAPILIANHSSALTDFIILLAFHLPAFLAMKQVRSYPILGRLAAGIGCIFVDRENGKSGVTQQICDRADEYTPGWRDPRLAIFPEGTVTQAQNLCKYRSGAFTPGAPVQPICIKYTSRGQDLSTLNLSGGPSDIAVFLRLITNIWNWVELEYLPVYFPSEEEKENPRLYASNVQRVMADSLGFPYSDHTFEDMYLQGKVGETYYNQHVSHRISGLQLKKLTGMKLKMVSKLLIAFSKLDQLADAPAEIQRVNAKPSALPTDSPKTAQPSDEGILGERSAAEVPKAGDELAVAGPGLLNRLSFLALAQGMTFKSLSVADEVFDVVSRGGVVDVVGAAAGLGLLLGNLPSENQIRIAFEWDEKGLVSKSRARAVMEVLEEGEEKKSGDGVVGKLYENKTTVSINAIVQAANTSPVIGRAAEAYVEQKVILVELP